MDNTARPIAIYLPQYHPIPENDEWWGKGFTEWTNVARARPLFNGHYQPHLPADLGFYDLRLPEVRQAQADMARQYGIHGFCYYHYWFNGRRLLERPFNDVLSSGKPDFPFCLCWANETWSRTWDGKESEILMRQNYSLQDDINHIRSLFKTFEDYRYIRVGNKPVFIIYRPSGLPNPRRTTDAWREEAVRSGIGDLYLCKVERFDNDISNPVQDGFDASIKFQPDGKDIGRRVEESWINNMRLQLTRTSNNLRNNQVYDYKEMVENIINKNESVAYTRYPCVTPMWDNSARRNKNAFILINSTPEQYKKWLLHTICRYGYAEKDENFVFINAWNEWAEGNHLEPCQKWGHSYLEATKEAFTQSL